MKPISQAELKSKGRPAKTAKLSRNGGARKQGRKEPESRLHAFGHCLRQHRDSLGILSQGDLATAIHRSQSFVAQLEMGKIVNPDRTLLQSLADAYNVVRDKLKESEKDKVPVASLELLVGWLVSDKYGIEKTKAELMSLQVLDIDSLADWETRVEADELWIIAPNFVDNTHKKIRQALVTRLKHGTVVRFFVKEADCEETGAFTMLVLRLREEMADSIGWESRLIHHSLNSAELRWISSSFVIANPMSLFTHNKKAADGYIIISQDSKPAYSFRMSTEELRIRTYGVQRWLSDKGQWDGPVVNPVQSGSTIPKPEQRK